MFSLSFGVKGATLKDSEKHKGCLWMAQIDNKDQYVHEVFNLIADDYDAMNNLMTWGMLKGWQKVVMDKTQLAYGGTGLDVCCGTGEMAFQMKKRVGPPGRVIGLDFTENMLAIANQKLAETDLINLEFVQGDAMDLPFADHTFDAATNGFALRNVLDIPKTISEMTRVVKPGGRVVCIDVSRPQNPLFRAFFNVYYFKAVPIMGHLVDRNKAVGDKFPAYTWLAESLKTFPNQETLKQIFCDAGLKDVGYKGLGFGAATVYWGTK